MSVDQMLSMLRLREPAYRAAFHVAGTQTVPTEAAAAWFVGTVNSAYRGTTRTKPTLPPGGIGLLRNEREERKRGRQRVSH